MLRLGRYQDVLADVTCDALIFDPPYSAKTHKGHNLRRWNETANAAGRKGYGGRDISYGHWTPEDVAECVAFWAPRNRGWWAVMSDDILAPVWRETLAGAGLYSFAPIPCVIIGMTCRMSGDGPSSWAVYLNVARPKGREFIGKTQPRGGTRPGAYVAPAEIETECACELPHGAYILKGRGGAREEEHIGGKPLELMRQIVRDYSLAGDLIADPCAGYATTGIAAMELGRRFVGAEVDPATALKGLGRLSAQLARTASTEESSSGLHSAA